MASVATAQPHNGGGACPSSEAMGGMNRKPPSASNSAATAPRSSRLVVQPKAPGQRVVLRQANALAIWPRTTALNAAPEAASSACPVETPCPAANPQQERPQQTPTSRRPPPQGRALRTPFAGGSCLSGAGLGVVYARPLLWAPRHPAPGLAGGRCLCPERGSAGRLKREGTARRRAPTPRTASARRRCL